MKKHTNKLHKSRKLKSKLSLPLIITTLILAGLLAVWGYSKITSIPLIAGVLDSYNAQHPDRPIAIKEDGTRDNKKPDSVADMEVSRDVGALAVAANAAAGGGSAGANAAATVIANTQSIINSNKANGTNNPLPTLSPDANPTAIAAYNNSINTSNAAIAAETTYQNAINALPEAEKKICQDNPYAKECAAAHTAAGGAYADVIVNNPLPATGKGGSPCAGGFPGVGIGAGQWAQTGGGIEGTDTRYCVQCGGGGDGLWGSKTETCGQGAATNYITRPDQRKNCTDKDCVKNNCWKNGAYYSDSSNLGTDTCSNGNWNPQDIDTGKDVAATQQQLAADAVSACKSDGGTPKLGCATQQQYNAWVALESVRKYGIAIEDGKYSLTLENINTKSKAQTTSTQQYLDKAIAAAKIIASTPVITQQTTQDGRKITEFTFGQTASEVHIENLQKKYELIIADHPYAFSDGYIYKGSGAKAKCESEHSTDICVPVPGQKNQYITAGAISVAAKGYNIDLNKYEVDVQTPEEVKIENLQKKYEQVIANYPDQFAAGYIYKGSGAKAKCESEHSTDICVPVPGQTNQYITASAITEVKLTKAQVDKFNQSEAAQVVTTLTTDQKDSFIEAYNLITKSGGKVTTLTATECASTATCLIIPKGKATVYVDTTSIQNNPDTEYIYKYQEVLKTDPNAFASSSFFGKIFDVGKFLTKDQCTAQGIDCVKITDSSILGYEYLDKSLIDTYADNLNVTPFIPPTITPTSALPENDFVVTQPLAAAPAVAPAADAPKLQPIPATEDPTSETPKLTVNMQTNSSWGSYEFDKGNCDNGAKISLARVGCAPLTVNNMAVNANATSDSPKNTADKFNKDWTDCGGSGADAVVATLEQQYGFEGINNKTGAGYRINLSNMASEIYDATQKGGQIVVASSVERPGYNDLPHINYLDSCDKSGGKVTCNLVDSYVSKGNVLKCEVGTDNLSCSDPSGQVPNFIMNMTEDNGANVQPVMYIAYPPGVNS